MCSLGILGVDAGAAHGAIHKLGAVGGDGAGAVNMDLTAGEGAAVDHDDALAHIPGAGADGQAPLAGVIHDHVAIIEGDLDGAGGVLGIRAHVGATVGGGAAAHLYLGEHIVGVLQGDILGEISNDLDPFSKGARSNQKRSV